MVGSVTATQETEALTHEEEVVYFPLRWESTGEQWWYAAPVDVAAANDHYALVLALLHLDPNLLIKLSSLPRLRRLEALWEDDQKHPAILHHAPRGRAAVAHRLLREFPSLLLAGYGGWLLYTAAAAADIPFIRYLIHQNPLLVLGEGEYGLTDILYAAGRSRSREVFRMLLDAAIAAGRNGGEEDPDGRRPKVEVFKEEVVNRAIHAAARGGSWEVLKEMLLQQNEHTLGCRDAQGCTVLHAAAASGQVEVVKNLIESFETINARDSRGNTPLHLAAYHGQLEVVKVLLLVSPSLSSARNHAGDTFLLMSVSGFWTPGFRRLDRQMELMKALVSGEVLCLSEMINSKNNLGRTALHLSVVGNIHCDLVELLMAVPSVDLNVCDTDGLTPLDLLRLQPRSSSSEILVKQLISAGSISKSHEYSRRRSLVSHLKMQGFGSSSPGTCFKLSDAEMFLCAGIENLYDLEAQGYSMRSSSCSNSCKSELSDLEIMNAKYDDPYVFHKSRNTVNSAAKRLSSLFGWSYRKDKSRKSISDAKAISAVIGSRQRHGDYDGLIMEKCVWFDHREKLIPLRQRYSKSLPMNRKQMFTGGNEEPSHLAKKKFAAGLTHGVIQGMPHLVLPFHSPLKGSSNRSASSLSSSEKLEGPLHDHEAGPSCSKQPIGGGMHGRFSPSNKMMNQYLCFGSHGLLTQNHSTNLQHDHVCGRSILSEA